MVSDWPDAHATCRPVPLSAVEIDGYLGRYVEQNLDSVMAALDSPLARGFEAVAAGKAPPPETDRLAADSDLYKWLEGACYVYARTRDRRLREAVDRIAALIPACQQPDGYINTQVPPYERFDPSIRHELYLAGHFCEAAVAHHRATGATELLSAATRWVDYLIGEHAAGHPYFSTSALMEHSEYEIAFARLARETGEAKYLDFAIALATELCSVGPTIADIRDGGALHAVRVGYLLAGLAELYLGTGRADLAQHLEGLWAELAETRMYVTGGMGSHGEHFSKTPYDLPHTQDDPNRTMGETCSSVAMILFSWRVHSMTGGSRCFDVIETILYNHLLGALSLDGLGCFYYNPLRVLGDQSGRTDHWHTPATTRCMLPQLNRTACCMPNFWRFLGALPEYLFSADDDGVFVNLYTDSRLTHTLPDGRDVQLAVQTRYPHDGRVTVRVQGDASAHFKLRLRIPRWCTAAEASWPGRETTPVDNDRYLEIARQWSPGDTVALDLPMPPRLIPPDPRIEANRGQVVFAKGPVLFCLEADADVPLDAVRVDVAADNIGKRVTEKWQPDLLGGITTLHLPGLINAEPVDLTLIPWSVRANRSDDSRWIIYLPTAGSSQ
ncbi:MAG: glycoside hydrolase family 127 protein [Planctomycetota bacterium]|jgi:DUF1680 family protein